MKFTNLQKVETGLFVTALGVISIISIIDIKPSVALSIAPSSRSPLYNKPIGRCRASTPEPHAVIGIVAMGILGCGYLLKRSRKNKVSDLNLEHQQMQFIPFLECDEIEDNHDFHSGLELQLVEPK